MSENLPIHQQKQQIQDFYANETSLQDILRVFFEYKRLIFFTTMVFVLLAIILSLLLKPVFKAKTTFFFPSKKDIVALNLIQLAVSNPESDNQVIEGIDQTTLYNQFQTQLQSQTIKRKVFDELQISNNFPDKGVHQSFDIFYKHYVLLKPKVKKREKSSGIVSLTLSGSKPAQLADVLNRIGRYANSKVITDVLSGIQTLRKNRIFRLEEEIRGLKKYSVSSIQDEVVKLAEIDKLSTDTITEKIKALRKTAKLNKQDRIKVLAEAASIAGKIGLIEPFSMKEGAVKIELLDSLKPLYYRGAKALNAEIEELKNRQSDDPFISELRKLQLDLELLKENEKIDILLQRKNNNAFITNLRKKELELSRLKAVNVDILNDVNAATIDQLAIPPKHKIKPRRSLIVAIGLLLGLLLGSVLAFLTSYLRNHPLTEE